MIGLKPDIEDLPEDTPGQRMKKQRLLKGLSVEELAKLSRTTRRCIYDWERDEHSSRPVFLKRIADSLGTSPEYIIGPQSEDASFGEQIKYIRICKGLTQKDLAEILGIARSSVGSIERGQRSESVYEKLHDFGFFSSW